jgi:GT2 family glycosyltransferase
MTKVSVVIPVHDHWNLTHSLLYDLYNHCRSDIDEVVVVNDASKQVEHYTGMEWWAQGKMLPIHELELETDLGFLRASNQGIKHAKGDIIILISNDVKIQENIIKKIVDALKQHNVLVGARLLSGDTGWNTFGKKTFPYLEGWLLAAMASDWDILGGFDERFAPCDFEDIDLSTTAIDKGYTLVSLEGAKVYHLGGKTIGFSPEREKITRANQEKFRTKWIKK